MQIKQIILLTAMTTSCFYAVAPNETPVYLNKTQPIEERVEDAISRMTL